MCRILFQPLIPILRFTYLKEVSVVVVVDEDLELLEHLEVLHDLDLGVLEPLPERVVVRVGDVQELGAARAQVRDRLDDVVRPAQANNGVSRNGASFKGYKS